MKKFNLFFLFFLLLFVFACTKTEVVEPKSTQELEMVTNKKTDIQNQNEAVKIILDSNYDYEKVEFNVVASKNEVLYQTLINSDFVNANLKISQLDMQNVTSLLFKDGRKFLTIPINGSNHTLSFSIYEDDYSAMESGYFIENNVDSTGNGIMTITTPTETFDHVFVNGVNTSVGTTTAGKSCFRICFDAAYDRICDGPIGCIAWYTNPQVPVLAIAYCGIECS